jgi:hypothetical protein
MQRHINDTESFWSYVGDFGPGILVLHTPNFIARPLLPCILHDLGVLSAIVDRDWIDSPRWSFEGVFSFMNEFTMEGLSVYGTVSVISSLDDVTAGWTLAHDRAYSTDRSDRQFVALRLMPQRAEAWRIIDARPTGRWTFENGRLLKAPQQQLIAATVA